MKASQLVKLILQEDVVQASEAPIEPSEAQDTLAAINNWMFEQAASGLNVGFTELKDLGDEVTVPLGALNPMVKNIGVQVAIQYGSVITPSQQIQADNSLRTLELIAVTLDPVSLPDTMPVGSGNECGAADQHFFQQDPDFIATEQGAIIAPEDNTGLP